MIFLDYNSTTPVDQRVLEAMLPYFNEKFGNAASKTHAYGWIADEAIKQAREQVASLIHAEPSEIVFTSGATESINLALKGIFENYQSKGKHIVTVATEHKAVLDTCTHLEKAGAEITRLPVLRDGSIDLNLLNESIRDDTILVAVMYGNNETGFIHPVAGVAKIVHQNGSIFFCDATQACGKIHVDVQADGIDLMSFSAHKIYGPKGTGALYVRRKNPRIKPAPLLDGGGHENGLRSGTLNVPGIVGFGKACEFLKAEMWDDAQRISTLRSLLEQSILELGNVYVNGSIKNRLPNVSNLSFQGIHSNDLIKELGDIAVSTGSACSSALQEPSHVLKAMGVKEADAYSSIRFSLGRNTTSLEIETVIREVKNAVLKIRASY